MYIFLAFFRTRTSFVGGHRGVVVVGVAWHALVPVVCENQQALRPQEMQGITSGFSWWEGAIPRFTTNPYWFYRESLLVEIFSIYKNN